MQNTITTHNGLFHADEVMAIAILRLYGIDYPVIRTRDQAVITDSAYVVDVGGVHDEATNRYDHHQYRGGKASAGLVWDEFGEELCDRTLPDETAQLFVTKVYETLIADIDAIDTGTRRPAKGEFSFSHAISSFNATGEVGTPEHEAGFNAALEFAKQVLINTIATVHKELYDLAEIKLAMADQPIVPVFPRYLVGMGEQAKLYGYKRFFFPDANGNGWRVQITEGAEPLDDLVKEDSGLIFLHPAKFICGVKEVSDAVRVATCW